MASRVCWHCNVKAHMTRQDNGSIIERLEASNGPERGAIVTACFRCDECSYLSLGLAHRPGPERAWITNLPEWFDHEAKVFWQPQTGVGKEFPDVPDQIAQAASEAHACRSIQANRAAVLLARSVIEATAKDKDIRKGTLADKIDALAAKALIRPLIQEAAHEVRWLGNDMAHGDFVEEVSDEAADEMLVLMGEVVEEVWQTPARVERVRAIRKAKEESTE